MSGFNTARDGQTMPQPKQMSSRLMTMKFMQRAVANTGRPQSTPNTPSSEPASKRQKIDLSGSVSATNSPGFDRSAFLDRKAITAAVKAEAATQALARARTQGEYGIETEWVLPLSLSNGTTNEASDDEDDDADDIWSSTPNGRQTYGSFKKKNKRVSKSTAGSIANDATLTPRAESDIDGSHSSSDSESGEVSSDDDSSNEDNEDTRLSVKKRKEPTIDYDNPDHIAQLDRIDLSRSSYAKSKGSFRSPSQQVGSGARYKNGGKKGQHGHGGKNNMKHGKRGGRKTL